MVPLGYLLLFAVSASHSCGIHTNGLDEHAENTCIRESCRPKLKSSGEFDEVSLLQLVLDKNTGRRDSPIQGCSGFDCIQQYVNLPDKSYHWKDTGHRISGTGSMYDKVVGTSAGASRAAWKGYVLNMTSQTWLENKVQFPVWWHTLVVIVPENRSNQDLATLHLDFGVNSPNKSGHMINFNNRGNDKFSITIDEHNLKENLASITAAAQKAAYVAVQTGAIAASLLNVPNGYQVFNADSSKTKRLREALRGYTYTNFLLHPEQPESLLEMPVAKAIVRAMDTITAFSETLPNPGKVERFAVSGYSKLGVATLIAGALDDRVQLVIPGATSLWSVATDPTGQTPALEPSFKKKIIDWSLHAPASEGMKVYSAVNFAGMAGDPAALKMHNIVDTITWLPKLTKPILYQAGSSDMIIGPYGIYNGIKSWLSLMPGQASVNMLPNAQHDDGLWEGLPSTAAFIKGFIQKKTVPSISEKFSPLDNTFEVTQVSKHKPISVQKWLHFDEYRPCGDEDTVFRKCPNWHGSSLEETQPGSGTWRVPLTPGSVKTPLGVYVTLTYEWPEPGYNFTVSSDLKQTTLDWMWGDPAALKESLGDVLKKAKISIP